MNRRIVLLTVPVVTTLLLASSLWHSSAQESSGKKRKVQKTDAEWAKILTRGQFAVTSQKATEPAYSGKYATSHTKGIYECVCCGAELFNSQTKFDSGTGWPSFYEPINPKRIDTAIDRDLQEVRTEVMCMDCGAHLGHVFNDGPEPTGLRFCINSAALKLIPATAAKKTAKTAKAKTTHKDETTPPTDEKGEPKSKETEKTTEVEKTTKGDPR